MADEAQRRIKISEGLKRAYKEGRRDLIEFREKMSKALKGRVISPEWRKKMSDAKKGKPGGNKGKHWKLSEEDNRKKSERMKGRKLSDKHRENLSKALMGNTIRGKGWHHPPEVCQKISEGMRGEKNWNWQGGIYKTNRDIRRSPAYKRWRISVFKRDKYKCKLCDSNKKIEANHIKRFSEYVELRFEVSNGITLCNPCHKKIRGIEHTVEEMLTKLI